MSSHGQRVLVTGCTGFVGSYVLARLLEKPERSVAALVRPDADLWRIGPELLARTTLIRGDLEHLDALREPLARFAPDTVVHSAWDGVGPKDRNDTRQLQNIASAIALLRLAQEVGVQHWIGMGSQAEYGAHDQALRETDAVRPTTLYGASKLSLCHLARLVAEQSRMRFVWLRIFSTYGPKDHPRWLIPYVILALLKGERPALTEGAQKWDYVHVDDIATAVRAVVDDGDAEGIYNVGSGRVVTIRRVVERIRDLVDARLQLAFGELLYRPDQVMHLEADIGRLQRATGWSPRIDFDSGLAETVGWYRAHRNRFHG